MTSALDADALMRRVHEARAKTDVPGIAFAVSLNGRTVSAASGVLNIDTGVEARPDSLFQVGSITKSLTATLVMQAADEGLLDIDAPITEYIHVPLGRGEYSGRFNARQLMSHTS